MTIGRRSLLKGAFATGLVSGLSGCDSDTTPSANKISFQASWINDAEFLGYFSALDPENNFYEKLGIDLDYLPGGPQVIPESSLLSGRAQIALTTPETTAQYIARDGVAFVIIGAQYQRNPIGVVSLASNPIPNATALVGKKLAVAPVNRLTVEAMFRLNDINPDSVELIPYTYDPQILINGTADATIDFVTNVPYAIKKAGVEPESFLLFDAGFKIYNDTVVVKREFLDANFEACASFLAASILGWKKVYDSGSQEAIARRNASSWFKGNGREIGNEIEFAANQLPLMESPQGFFNMSERGIRQNIESLQLLGLEVSPEIFDTKPLARALQLVGAMSA